MNIKEVADYLRISEEEVKDLVTKGEIPAYKVGGLLLRFKKDQVEYYRKKSASGDIPQGGPPEAMLAGGGLPANKPESRFAHLVGDRGTGAGRRIFRRQGEAVPYSFVEKLEDFLYYNDFYILSIILLFLVVFAIFEI